MGVSAGTRLGPYEITAFVGAGGMGEVYRARDTRLGRDIAVKVLPESVRRDEAALARFEREARAVGALSHPNIVAIHDVGRLRPEGASAGHGEEVEFVVMELLEGETLRARLQRARSTPTPRPEPPASAPADGSGSGSGSSRGGLPIRKALDIAGQIAQGLAAAHAKGLVHRDLKPENVFLTTDGRVKVLDFGLARALAPDTASAETGRVDVALAAGPDTTPGTVLGTVGYMAPEQVRGQAADHRADIFALGAVLFEMLTGERAFVGASAIETMSAILRVDPLERAETAIGVPANLAAIVRHCLEKEPDERFQSARDLAFQLQAAAGGSSVSGPAVALAPPRRARGVLPWVAATAFFALSTIAAIILWHPWSVHVAPAPPTGMFTIAPPESAGSPLGVSSWGPAVRISPDGQQLAFSRGAPGAPASLFVRALKGLAARQVASGTSVSPACWSPDGRSLAFNDRSALKRVDLDGGVTRTLCEQCINFASSCAWAPDGTILLGGSRGVRRIPAAGGTLAPVTTLDGAAKEQRHEHPSFLPDGRHFLYLSLPERVIWAGSLDGSKPVRLMPADSGAVYAPPGYLLFAKGTTLFAQRFDADRLTLSGDATPVAEDVRVVTNADTAAFTVSSTGVLVYRTGNPAPGTQLVWYDRTTGRQSGVVKDSAAEYNGIAFMPGERSVVASIREKSQERGKPGLFDLWRIELDTGVRTRLTSDPANDVDPVVSPDGAWVAWASSRPQSDKPINSIFRRPSDGTGADERWIALPVSTTPTQWSANWLVIKAAGEKTGLDIWVAPVADPAKARAYLQTQFLEADGRLSPDERWMAYTSFESGKAAVYVRPFPDKDAGGKWRVSGTSPLGYTLSWRGDGKELFYQDSDRVMAVAMTLGDRSIVAGEPREVLRMAGAYSPMVTRDGQRFLVWEPLPLPPGPPEPLTVVINWLGLIAPAAAIK